METIARTFIAVFFLNYTFAQNNKTKADQKDTIVFSFNEALYNKIALDSVKMLFGKQYEFYSKHNIKNSNLNHPSLSEKLISSKYKLNELDYFPIPQFRLYRDGYEQYNCNNDIENFIVFEEYSKYQYCLILKKGKILNKIEIPNKIFELDRIYPPSLVTISLKSKENYEEFYINSLIDISEAYKGFYKQIKNSDNFFFYIYGLKNVLFEIDKKSNLLYANFSSYDYGDVTNSDVKMLANEFIRKYVGEKVIKELCKGNYLEVNDLILTNDYTPCKKIFAVKKKIFLKVIRQ